MTIIQEMEFATKAIQIGLRELDTLPKLSFERSIVFLAVERDVKDLQELWNKYHGEMK